MLERRYRRCRSHNHLPTATTAACSGYKIESSLQAHPGGFSALDAQGELVATAGYVNRMGRLALDTYAKVGGLWRGCREGWLVGEPTGREGGSEYSRGSV